MIISSAGPMTRLRLCLRVKLFLRDNPSLQHDLSLMPLQPQPDIVMESKPHLSLLDNDVLKGSVLEGDEVHVSLHHVEELLALFQVEVLPLVGSTHVEHLQLPVAMPEEEEDEWQSQGI